MTRAELFAKFEKMATAAGFVYVQISHDAFAVRERPTRKPMFEYTGDKWDSWRDVTPQTTLVPK